MRRPPNEPARPARPPRPPRSNRSRAGLVVAGVVLFLLITSLRGIASFYTDFLFFDELSLGSVWRGVLGAKIGLAVVFTLVFFVLMWVNLAIAERLAPRFRSFGPDDEVVVRYQEMIGPYAGRIRLAIAALFALIAGTGASGQWSNWIMFRNGVDFGVKDPQFGEDIALFVFRLPFLSYVVNWLFVAIVLVLIMSVVQHYLNGGVRLQAVAQRVTPQVKAHVSVLLAVLALLKAAAYHLGRYELAYSTRGPVNGPTYTDVNVQLPAFRLLIVIMLVATVLFIINIRMRGWVLPVIAVALWGLVSFAAGVLYPAFIQKFRVEPNELAQEREYIARNITATRRALKLDRVQRRDFAADVDLNAAGLAANEQTISNIRLWDPALLERTYQVQEERRSYFRFTDVDVDRYEINGKTTQVVLSARELNPDGLPAERDSWVNRHLQYTHGFGAVLSPANAVTSEGNPAYLLQDLPPRGEPTFERAEIYYGQNLGSYAIVNTDQDEIDFTTEAGTDQTSNYKGAGGVHLGSRLTRAALALRFGDINIMTSSAIQSRSRAIYFRDILERAQTAAPFLRYDSDPYPVIIDGRVKWILDAYTLTNRYPYAQRATQATFRLPDASDLRGASFNYLRNSVKVVVDSYDGTLDFHVVDNDDPIVKTYQKAFPELFQDGPIPASLREHFRYPEDLFRIQTHMYGRYHIGDAEDFYRQADAWNVAKDPGSGRVSAGEGAAQIVTAPTTPGSAARASSGDSAVNSVLNRMDPYYLLMRLPGEEDEDFLILQPFVPTSRDDRRQELEAFMIGKSDPDDYGDLEVFVMPRGQTADGPAIVDARIRREVDISREITLLNSSGSQVLFGNLLVIPIEDSLLYVRAMYVQDDRLQAPQFKNAIVVFGDKVIMRRTLKEALTAVFGSAPPTLEEEAGEGSPAPTTPGEPSGPPTGAGGEQVQALLDQAAAAFAAADDALAARDLAEFDRRYKEGVELVQRAKAASSPTTTSTTSTTAPSA